MDPITFSKIESLRFIPKINYSYLSSILKQLLEVSCLGKKIPSVS